MGQKRWTLAAAAVLAGMAGQVMAGQIVCDFNSNLDQSSLHTTIMGVPGQDPVWIAQSLAVQSQWTEEGEGVWIGAASRDPEKQVAEIMMSFFEWHGDRALGVSLLAAPLAEAEPAAEAVPVWAVLEVDGAEVAAVAMHPTALPAGHFPKAEIGYLADGATGADFAIDPLAMEIVSALVAGTGSVTLEIHRAPPEAEIAAEEAPLARFGFDPAALQADFAWLLDAAPGYVARFQDRCPNNLYGRAG